MVVVLISGRMWRNYQNTMEQKQRRRSNELSVDKANRRTLKNRKNDLLRELMMSPDLIFAFHVFWRSFFWWFWWWSNRGSIFSSPPIHPPFRVVADTQRSFFISWYGYDKIHPINPLGWFTFNIFQPRLVQKLKTWCQTDCWLGRLRVCVAFALALVLQGAAVPLTVGIMRGGYHIATFGMPGKRRKSKEEDGEAGNASRSEVLLFARKFQLLE